MSSLLETPRVDCCRCTRTVRGSPFPPRLLSETKEHRTAGYCLSMLIELLQGMFRELLRDLPRELLRKKPRGFLSATVPSSMVSVVADFHRYTLGSSQLRGSCYGLLLPLSTMLPSIPLPTFLFLSPRGRGQLASGKEGE